MKVKMLKDGLYSKEGHRIEIAKGEVSDLPCAIAKEWLKKGLCTEKLTEDKKAPKVFVAPVEIVEDKPKTKKKKSKK